MDHNETSFLQGTLETRRSSASRLRVPVPRKGRHPFPRLSGNTGKRLRVILTVGLQFMSALSNSMADNIARWREMFRLLACVLFNIGGSPIDDGVNFGPPG